jgi:hypothetical protein
VMVIVNPLNGYIPSSASIKGWFSWATGNPALKAAVDRWQVGNEPDRAEYWRGSLSQYVNGLLKPAAEVLHAAGEQVVSAGPSWNPETVRSMINLGLLDHVDYVGYHPYGNFNQIAGRVALINSVVAGRKPIIASEWNVRGFENGSATAWANAVKQIFPTIKSGFAINYYFGLKKTNAPAGPGGIFLDDGTPNQPFHAAFSTFRGAGGITPVTPTPTPIPTPTPTPVDPGNTPGGISGSISGRVWKDTDGDGIWDQGEANAGVQTVYVDTNTNGLLDTTERRTTSNTSGYYSFTGLAAGTYNVTRLLTAGQKITNPTSAAGAGVRVINLARGQVVSSIHLGAKTTAPVVITPVITPPVITPPVVTPAPTFGVNSISLTNANGVVLKTFTSNATVQLTSLATRNVAIVANTFGSVKSVKLTGLGKTVTENYAPFALLGGGVWQAAPGTYTFTASGYSGLNLTGTQGRAVSVTLTFI